MSFALALDLKPVDFLAFALWVDILPVLDTNESRLKLFCYGSS